MAGDEGRRALQHYMNPLVPPLNSALNVLAVKQPADPLKALVHLLSGGDESESWDQETLLVPSAELCAQMQVEQPAPMTVGALMTKLADHGLLRRHAIATDAPPKSAPLPSRISTDVDAWLGPRAPRREPSTFVLNRWQRALQPALEKVRSREHPWHEYEIHKRPTELCVRYDYDATSGQWETSETLIKMEDVSFARGAMRECFRMKKMSQVPSPAVRPSYGPTPRATPYPVPSRSNLQTSPLLASSPTPLSIPPSHPPYLHSPATRARCSSLV